MLTWKQRFQREKQYAAKVTQNASGEYVVQLNLVEGNVARLSIDLPVPEHAMAERMARRWPECAGKVYQQLLKALCEENE